MELSHEQAVIRLRDIRAELERLHEKPELTPEDRRSFDEMTVEFGQVDDHRQQLERKSALERVRSATTATERGPAALQVIPGASYPSSGDGYDADPVLHPDSVEAGRFRNPWDLSEIRTFGRDKGAVTQELRARALSAVERMQGTHDGVRQAAASIIEKFDDGDGRIARMCLATSSPEYLRAWSKVASGRGHMLTGEEQGALTRAMSLTDSAGGFLVPFQMDPTLIITSDGSRNQIRQVARQVVATGDVWNGVSSGAVSWSWDAEATEVSDDSTTFGQPTVPVYTARGFVPISMEALEDASNVTAEVARLLAFGKDVLEAQAFTTGSGVGQPTGIVTALAAASPSVIVSPGTAETFASGDVYKVDSALPARHRANASWLANRAVYNLIRQFDSSGGTNLWERIGNGMPNQLLGRPALESESMDADFSAAATANNYLLAYGDFENYVIADRIGMTVEFIPHLMHTSNNRPSGQRGWFAWYRAGADSVQDGAFRLLNIATTA